MPRRATATSYGGIAGNDASRNKTVPGTGRLPDVYKRRMALLRDLAAQSERWKLILQDTTGEYASNGEWLATVKEVYDRTEGKAAQSVDVTTGGQPLTLTVEERAKRLAELAAMIAAR